MGTVDIITLCFSAPAFLISFAQIIYYFFKQKFKISLIGSGIGSGVDNYGNTIFHLQINNTHKEPLSIHNITINDKKVFVVKENEYYEFQTIDLSGYQSITLELDADYSNLFDKIEIKCYTTRRILPYKKSYKSFISWCNKNHKTSRRKYGKTSL